MHTNRSIRIIGRSSSSSRSRWPRVQSHKWQHFRTREGAARATAGFTETASVYVLLQSLVRPSRRQHGHAQLGTGSQRRDVTALVLHLPMRLLQVADDLESHALDVHCLGPQAERLGRQDKLLVHRQVQAVHAKWSSLARCLSRDGTRTKICRASPTLTTVSQN